MRTILYRIGSYLWHRLRAWNTTGEGIHSPYLFYIVRFLLRDTNRYYCWASIERQRDLLRSCADELTVTDYGSSGSPAGLTVRRRVCDIAKNHLETPAMGQILFRLATFLSQEAGQPIEILELGSSLGITTAYLAMADSRNRVTTMEGSSEVLRVAKGVWRALKIENIEWKEGNIDAILDRYAREKTDLVFIDANHTYEATLRYVNFLLPRLPEKGILVIDDIHHSPEMARAWNVVKADGRVTTTIDLWHAGLVFVDTHYLKRHYRVALAQ